MLCKGKQAGCACPVKSKSEQKNEAPIKSNLFVLNSVLSKKCIISFHPSFKLLPSCSCSCLIQLWLWAKEICMRPAFQCPHPVKKAWACQAENPAIIYTTCTFELLINLQCLTENWKTSMPDKLPLTLLSLLWDQQRKPWWWRGDVDSCHVCFSKTNKLNRCILG